MARSLKKQKSLISAAKKRIFPGIALIILGLAAVLLPIIYSLNKNKQFICLIGGFCIIVFGISIIRRGFRFLAGAKGENKVTEILTSFPKYWYIFNDVRINDSQIDHIVVCPKGIFTIETKNHKGTIYGNAEKKEWSQVIDDRRGRKHKISFYNPVKQGKKHSLELNKFLKKEKIVDIFVKTIVVFSNPDVTLKVYSRKIPVVLIDELEDLLVNERSVLSGERCFEIARKIQETLNVLSRK